VSDNHNPDVLQNFFNEMMTRGLVANAESLVEFNDKMSDFKPEDVSEENIEDACISEIQSIESAFGPIFGDYHREDDRIILDMSTKDMGFFTSQFRSAMMIMEAFASAMASQRKIATDVEALVNNLIVKPHCEDTSHETFSHMVAQGHENRLVDQLAVALSEVSDTNVFHHLAQYLLELTLVSHDHHGAQRMLSQLVSGTLVEMYAMEQIRQRAAKPALKAVQGIPQPTQATTNPAQQKPPEGGGKVSFLSVVKRD
jgi:hypothetical protein